MEDVLDRIQEKEDRRSRLARQGWTRAKVIQRAAECAGLKASQVRGASKGPSQSKARALACKWLVEDLGQTTVAVGRVLRIRQTTASACVARGREIEAREGIRLEGQRSGSSRRKW